METLNRFPRNVTSTSLLNKFVLKASTRKKLKEFLEEKKVWIVHPRIAERQRLGPTVVTDDVNELSTIVTDKSKQVKDWAEDSFTHCSTNFLPLFQPHPTKSIPPPPATDTTNQQRVGVQADLRLISNSDTPTADMPTVVEPVQTADEVANIAVEGVGTLELAS